MPEQITRLYHVHAVSLFLLPDELIAVPSPTQIEADAARAEGTIVYAVGVGTVPEATLEAIGGGPANVFDVSDFTELDGESTKTWLDTSGIL